MRLKKSISLLLAVVLSLSLAIPAFAAEHVTRGDAVEALYELSGRPDAGGDFFADTGEKPYATAAAWAKTAGVSNGVGDGVFDGDRDIARGELATMLHRYAKYEGFDVSVGEDTNILSYDDAFELPGWSVAAWQWACGSGVMEAKGSRLAYAEAVELDELTAALGRLAALPAAAAEPVATLAPSVDEIDKYGDIRLAITSGELAQMGYQYADLVKVSFNGQSVVLPVIPEYRYVGAKAAALVMWRDEGRAVELEVFNGSFAQTYGLAERKTREDGSRYHVALDGVEFPVEMTIELSERDGYADTYAIFDLTRTNERGDYAGLSDAQYANFRMVTTTGMGAGKLYRASSPINPSIGRNTYADKASENALVKSFVNLADSAESAAKYAGYAESYYSKQNVLFLNLGVDFTTELNRAGVKEAMSFLADAPTPVLVHCNEGQDRAGFMAALLECLMGASLDEVKQDYMVSFYNYYGVTAGTEQYTKLTNNIVKNLKTAFGVEELETVDLAKEAEEYLLELGVTADEIKAVKQNLGGEAVRVTGKVTAIEKYGHALLDVTIEDFNNAGFTLGDVVTVAAGSYNDSIPYFNGYYVDRGGYMVRAYPSHTNIGVCINYGKFAETVGIGVGDVVTLTLAVKGGALVTQEVNSLVYTNERADYASDEVFANFRAVKMDGVGENKLFRSASPVNNENNRAATANRLAEAAGIKTVMNLAETPAEIDAYAAAEGFDSAFYKKLYDEGGVIALGMPINFAADEFAAGIVKGLTFLSEREAPYLVHCTEGKDRAGFAAMLLEMLAGAKLDDIVADYMISFVNYYHIDPEKDAAKYEMIAEKNVMEMLRTVCGADKGASLEGVDLSAAAVKYLTSHGMAADAVSALQAKLH